MSKLHFVVYSKTQCPACMMTKRKLNELGVNYVDNYYGDETKPNLIDLTDESRREWSEQKITKLKEKYGVSSMPIVKVVDEENNLVDVFGGLNMQKLNEWSTKVEPA